MLTPAAIPFPPLLPLPDSRQLRNVDLESLFDEIIRKTEERESFSEVKEANIGFSALEDMKRLRSEFIASSTELELYYALWKLSNARRDRHLAVIPVEGGLEIPEPRCFSAPIQVLPDFTDLNNTAFFVASVGESSISLNLGDIIVGVNGRSIAEYVKEFTAWIRHSSPHGLYWEMAYGLPKQLSEVPHNLYSRNLHLRLERPSGDRYDVTLAYTDDCYGFGVPYSLAEFVEVMRRDNFNVFLDRGREIVLLQWLDFERDDLVKDIPALMKYAEQEQILD